MRCEFCLSGHTENCLHPGDYLARQGGFADYIAIPKSQVNARSVYMVPDEIDFELATLGEPLSSVYACQENIDVTIGDTVVILGAGPIGCFHAQLAKQRGAFTVIMTDINDKRLELARQYGVDHIINSSMEDPVEVVRKLTHDLGADKAISANPTTEAQNQCIYMLKKGGTGVFFGGVARGKIAEIDTNYVHYNNLWLYGHYGASVTQCKKAFELAMSPRFPTRKFLTHIMPLSEINEAIRLTQSGEAIKVVLVP
jgi:L-iditol 2-dehydrogenase